MLSILDNDGEWAYARAACTLARWNLRRRPSHGKDEKCGGRGIGAYGEKPSGFSLGYYRLVCKSFVFEHYMGKALASGIEGSMTECVDNCW